LAPPGDHPPSVPLEKAEPKREAVRARIAWGPGLTKTQAEELLDWLEAHDIRDCEVTYEEGHGFTIHFPAPAPEQAPWPLSLHTNGPR
jgi:hypothetical protein